jgi:hypothetical protein
VIPIPSTASTPQALISIAGLERALSAERLQAYRLPADRDVTHGLARYIWNLALADAVAPLLHAFEVTLRNEVVRTAGKIVPARIAAANAAARANAPAFLSGTFPSWLDVEPTMLLANEKRKLDRAKSELGNDRRTHTEGHLIAKLDLGFWVALCRHAYADTRAEGPRLWPVGLKQAFRYRPAEITTASAIFHQFDLIREFRNRVAHHDPIWDRDYLGKHEHILVSLAWMAPKLADALRTISRSPAGFAAGPGAYRPLAEDILGTGAGSSSDPVTRVVRALRSVPEDQRPDAATAMIEALVRLEP